MKHNKITKLFLTIIFTLCCCATMLVGCGKDDETHNHTFSTAWSFNQNEHWHTATCEHKSETSEKTQHTFNGNICSICNYDKANPQVDTSTEYSITFNANNGSFSQGTTIKKVANGNSLLIAPTEPTRPGYAFAGWARQANGENLWNFSEDRVSQDMTLYAKWLQIFNVNYDANGGNFTNGSTIFEIDVKFGDKLEIPSPPSRENYKFTRWYKDSALSQEWLFDEDVVCSEFTLYAGWESTIIEQEVTYNLNYDGQESLKMSTEEGRVTLVPTREGYVFNGWWISDGQTEDGTFILVQKWDTAEIVTVSDLVLYAEWVEKSTVSSQLPAPSVNIDGETFSWDTIEGAVRYDVRVYEIGSNEELTSATVNGTRWTFPNGYDAGYYTVNVRAIGDGVNTVNSVYVSKNYGHHILSAISKIEFDITTSVLTWSPVRNATSYELYANNILVDTITYTTYDFSNYEAGEYQVKIVALRNEYQSSTTSQTIEKLRLKTPKVQLYIDEETNDYVLMWDNIVHADTYTLNFNGIEIKIEDTTFYRFNNSANFWDDANSVTITMTAFDSSADYLVSLSTDGLSTNKVYVLNLDKNAANAGSVSTKGEVYIEQNPIDDGLVTNKYLIKGDTDSQNFDSTVYVESNKSITITAETTDNRYIFDGWYNGGTKVSSESSYTFSMPNENVTYTAKWIYYTLSLNKSIDEAGSITNANSQVIKVGDEVTITAITNSGYTWVGWYNGKTKLTDELSYTFLMPAENVNYVAKWIACPVTLEKSIDEAGSISGIPETTKVGEEITIIAETNSGYTWIGWYDGDTRLTSELSYTFTVPSRNVTYIAKWIAFPVSFEKSIDEAGSISGLPETTKVGDKITINASTNAGYTWVGWYNGNTKVCDDLSYTFSVPAESVNYVAKWITCPVTLGKSIDEAGSISGLPDTTKVGDNVTVTATTNNGYTWVGWYNGDAKVCDELSYTFVISTENVTYTAKWIKISLTQDSSLAGTISSLNESYIVGEEVTITASTNEGYTWDGWYKGTVKLTNDMSYTFNMPAENTTYTAKWIANAFEITLNAQGGTLENSSKVTIKMGEISTLEVPTKTGYYFGGWYTIDKVKIADMEGNMLSHWNMADDTELVAQWLRPLVFNENGGGAIDTQYVEPGTIVTLPTTTKTGHTFNGWTYNSSTYTGSFTMPDAEVTMDAKWTANTYYIYYNGTSLKVTYGQYYSIPTPTKTGYTFRYFTKSGSTTRFSSSGYYNITSNTSLSCKWVKELSTTVSGAKTISCSSSYLENGMTFTITYSGSTMKCFKIETNAPVNVVFVGTGYSYSNDTSCGVNSHGGSTTMTIRITIPDISKISGTFTCKFTCTTYIQSGDGI